MNKLETYRDRFRTELLDSCAPFWLKYGNDREHGGVLTCLDRKGDLYSSDKSVWMQGRAGWMYSYLYRHIDPCPEYLTFAKSCIDFARNHCIDTDGRMFFTVTADGKPLRKRRYWFSETFYIMANAEYAAATGAGEYLAEARKYFDFVLSMYRDPATDPFAITPKTCAATRDMKALANPMILFNVTTVMRDADPENAGKYNAVLSELERDIRCFHLEEYGAMLENVTVDNRLVPESAPCRVVNPGHDIECSWFLYEEGVRSGNTELTGFAKQIFDEAFARGWDAEYGGILYFRDLLGKPVEAYEHDMKLWWPHNEAMIASLMLWLHTEERRYADRFRQVTDYAFAHFSDPEYGEWFGYLRRDGKPTEPPCKGHTYKGPFHVMRMLAKCLLLFDEAERTGKTF